MSEESSQPLAPTPSEPMSQEQDESVPISSISSLSIEEAAAASPPLSSSSSSSSSVSSETPIIAPATPLSPPSPFSILESQIESALSRQSYAEAALGLNSLQRALFSRGDLDGCITQLQQLSDIQQTHLDDKLGYAQSLKAMGNCHMLKRALSKAMECYQDSLEISQDLLAKLTSEKQEQKDENDEKERIEQGIQDRTDILTLISACLCNLGACHRTLGEAASLLDLHQKAQQHLQQPEATPAPMISSRSKKAYEEALALYTRACTIDQVLDDKRGQITIMINQGICKRGLGQVVQAASLHSKAIEQCSRIGDQRTECLAHQELGRDLLASVTAEDASSAKEALSSFCAALDLALQMSDPDAAASTMGGIASCYQAMGEPERAQEMQFKARNLKKEMAMQMASLGSNSS